MDYKQETDASFPETWYYIDLLELRYNPGARTKVSSLEENFLPSGEEGFLNRSN
jgi:hypothetical protein